LGKDFSQAENKIQKSMYKVYRNVTGPGEYEQLSMTGDYLAESNKRNQPKYSFGLKQDFTTKNPPVISKDHMVDFLSKESPGAGAYSPDATHSKFSKTAEKWSIPKDKRFKGPGSELANHEESPMAHHRSKTLKEQSPGPGSYLGKYGNSSIENFSALGRVGKESRFTNKNPLYQTITSPGPGRYEMGSYKSVSTEANTHQAHPGGRRGKSFNSNSKNSQSILYSTFGNTFDKYEKVYHKENVKAFISKDSPGPAQYSPNQSFTKGSSSLGYSFTKNNRKLNKIKSNRISPNSFRHEDPSKNYKKDLIVKFSKAKREVDFTKYTSLNSVLVSKGLY